MIPYVGDISRDDAKILKDLAEQSERILEFGVGASTQVLAAYGKGNAPILTVETSLEWVSRTQQNLNLLGITREVMFADYYTFLPIDEYDLIFDDGADEFRLPFAYKTWPNLKIGGYMLFHDTRRGKDVQNIADFIVMNSPEIESIFINKDHSNITVIKKKKAEFYENWNVVEKREPWVSGYEPVDIEKQKAKILEFQKLMNDANSHWHFDKISKEAQSHQGPTGVSGHPDPIGEEGESGVDGII